MSERMNIEYHISEEELDPHDITGGIQFSINGNRINEFYNEDTYEPFFDWEPQYVGEYLHTDFKRLIDRTREIAAGEAGLYDQRKVQFDPNTIYLILEPVGPQHIRVAYRNQVSDDVPLTAPKTACGYVVDRRDFCQAVSESAHEYVEDLQSMPLEWGMELLNEFEVALADLDTAIENLE